MFGLASKSSFLGAQTVASRPVVAFAPRKAFVSIEAAHKKGAGSTKNGRDSNSKRRGVKVYGAQEVKAGGIIIRQQGSTVRGSSHGHCLQRAERSSYPHYHVINLELHGCLMWHAAYMKATLVGGATRAHQRRCHAMPLCPSGVPCLARRATRCLD